MTHYKVVNDIAIRQLSEKILSINVNYGDWQPNPLPCLHLRLHPPHLLLLIVP
jgi:hypothetical protein